MSQIHAYIELTSDLVNGFAALCNVPFELDAIAATSVQNGWRLVPPEEWEVGGDPFLRIQIASDCPSMIALFGPEFVAGLPLVTLFRDDFAVGISESNWSEFDSRFFEAERLCAHRCGEPTRQGEYSAHWTGYRFKYALFQRERSTLAVLQHYEGDGHLGNDASLDVRIIPLAAEAIELPLTTNLIF